MTGVPSPSELCLISQNQNQILKLDDVEEIKLTEWHNPLSDMMLADIETDSMDGNVFQRVAPSETEIKQEEESIRKWKEGKLG